MSRAAQRGETGESCTHRYLVMNGRWNVPEKTTEAIDDAAWTLTGDLATMDDQGYVNHRRPADDMVIHGGENVYPREHHVDGRLDSRPEVARS